MSAAKLGESVTSLSDNAPSVASVDTASALLTVMLTEAMSPTAHRVMLRVHNLDLASLKSVVWKEKVSPTALNTKELESSPKSSWNAISRKSVHAVRAVIWYVVPL